MNAEIRPLPPGLYFVATPIGTARDITLRALDILASADVIASEDTRTTRKLMDIHGIALRDRPLIAYHDHSTDAVRARLIKSLAAGQSVAYASEAGTPMISDPGYALARDVTAAGYLVTSAPGPSAVIAALTIAGLPTDRFLFAGFLPNAQTARRTALQEFTHTPATLVFYESPKRIHKTLADIADIYGQDREIAVCRELTKKFEEVLRGPVSEVISAIADRTLKGEIVICVDKNRTTTDSATMEDALKDALLTMSVKDAANAVSIALGLPKRVVYQAALNIGKPE